MDPRQVQIEAYTYELPEERIAKYPLPERDSSKLLVYREGRISEGIYRDIDQFVPENSLLIFNNTKVIQARLNVKNSTGASLEIFCLEPAEENPEQASAMNQKASVYWICLIKRASKWREKTLYIEVDGLSLSAEKVEKVGETYRVKFSWQPSSLTFAEVLLLVGNIPIPPYLKRESEDVDQKRYQTIYALHKGSVAAPTAGLHFTETVFEKLRKKKVVQDYVTLHVGAGTFKPVKSETIADHEMHSEWIEVQLELLKNLLSSLSATQLERKIIAVGTTSLRTIESLYWMGVKAHNNPIATLKELEVKQWDPYTIQQELSAKDALFALLEWFERNHTNQLICKTQVIIAPPYRLRIANALITNFHQPRSTLLLLIAAIVGDEWKSIYNYALDNDYRFLSYGDGSILFS